MIGETRNCILKITEMDARVPILNVTQHRILADSPERLFQKITTALKTIVVSWKIMRNENQELSKGMSMVYSVSFSSVRTSGLDSIHTNDAQNFLEMQIAGELISKWRLLG